MASTSGQGGALSSRNNYWNAKTWIYDVFLSFRGEDTRRNFTDHLYNALVDKRIRTFRDDEKMERGKVIKQEIPKAIEESMISIVIFSKNFAFSRWCLEEVAKIIQCMKELGQTVLPVFYHVDPSDVRNQTGSFGEAFKEYDGSKEKMETVQRWRDALSEAGNLSGWDLQYGYEYESKRIKEITEVVLKRLNREHPNFYKANEESEMTNMYISKKNSYVQKYSWSGNVSIPEGQRDIRLNRTCVFKSNVYSFTCDFQDIDGCKNQSLDLCVNIDASFNTSCLEGYHGVDSKEKKRPFVNPLQLIKVSIGSPWSYLGRKKRMLKDKLFQRNGSLVLPRMLRVKLFERNSGLVRPRMPKVKLFQGNSGLVLPPMPKVKLFQRKSGLVLPRMPKVKLFQLNSGLQLNKDIIFRLSSLSLKHFTANEVKKITNNYDEIIGEGGSAIVYKGVLKSNIEVAVKRLKNTRDLETFVNEAVVLHRMNHKNVVSLLGWCFDTEFPVLVYEYVSNGTLDQHILDERDSWRPLSWEIRLRIAVEIARALSFLHYEASPPMIHRDIKPSNILLDQNYTAKLTDFGLAKLDNTRENSNLDHKTLEESNRFTAIKGTYGYLDPEYATGLGLTKKSDVYGFGVVLVQLLTAREAVDTRKPDQEKWLAPYFSSCLENNRLFEIVDSCLILNDKKSQIMEFVHLAHRCLQNFGCNRPTMRKVAQDLSMMLEEESSNMVPHSTAKSIPLSRAASFHSTEISSPTSPFDSFDSLKETSYDSSTFI